VKGGIDQHDMSVGQWKWQRKNRFQSETKYFFYFIAILRFNVQFYKKTKVTYITITTYKLQSTMPINIAYNTNNDNNNNNNIYTTNGYNTTTAANTLF